MDREKIEAPSSILLLSLLKLSEKSVKMFTSEQPAMLNTLLIMSLIAICKSQHQIKEDDSFPHGPLT